MASTIRVAFSPESSRAGARLGAAASMPGDSSPASPARSNDRGRPSRDALGATVDSSERELRGGDRRGRRGRRSAGRRRVLELLLGPEQSVENLGAQLVARRERDDDANSGDEQLAAQPLPFARLALCLLYTSPS